MDGVIKGKQLQQVVELLSAARTDVIRAAFYDVAEISLLNCG